MAVETVRVATHAMGTRFEFVLIGDDPVMLRAAGEEGVAIVEEAHRRLSRFERGSVVAAINTAGEEAGGGAVRVDDELFEFLTRCEGYRLATDDAFRVVRGTPGGGGLRLDPASRRVAVGAGTTLDPGGVGKGFALDLVSSMLRGAGVERAFLHGGSSTMVAIGSPPGLDGWRVAMPGANGTGASGLVVLLRDLAMSVSTQFGDRPGHVVDPRTGLPATGAAWSACLGAVAEETDAWSTALVVLGLRPPACPAVLTTVLPADEEGSILPGRVTIEGPDSGVITMIGGGVNGERA
jgi:thiamine biosynthesis lipoprotein